MTFGHRGLVVASFGLAVLSGAMNASAQTAGSTLTIAQSYGRARALLDSSIAVHGGVAPLRAAGRIRAVMSGHDYWRNQSPSTDSPYNAQPFTGDLQLDLPRSRLVWETTSHFPGGFDNHNRNVIDGPNGFSANLRQRLYANQPGRSMDSQRGVLFRLPHLALLAALDNATGLRWVGPTTLSSGAVVSAITTSTAGGSITLGIDPRTKELRALLDVRGDAVAGDAAIETEFTGYSRKGAILVPQRRVNRIAGEVTQDLEYATVTLDGTIPDSLLTLPPGLAEFKPAPGEPVRELGPGVWAVQAAGYWSLAVAFSDHVLVVEAPGNGVPETMSRIATLAPGKPIRYVVPTHHHDDHAGGMRHYMAAGVNVVTTPGNRPYFERMARANSSLQPDSLGRSARPVRIEAITGGRRTFTDGTRTIEIRDIGPSPHANEMVVAWIPAEGVLFQGDLFNPGSDGSALPGTVNATTRHFADWIAKEKLDVRLIAGVHGPAVTRAQFDEAIRADRQQ